LPICGREVEQARVMMMVGENPDDVRARWIKLCEVMGQDPRDLPVSFLPGVLPLSASTIRRRIESEMSNTGELGLVIVDTSAAYFEGDDENNNIQMIAHARLLRSLVKLFPGDPTILALCHPVKNFSEDNLLPRGGGAFVAEIDSNLVLYQRGDMAVAIHWQGKHRGPEFEYLHFKIEPGTSEKLRTAKGKPVWTVIARPIDEAEASRLEDRGQNRMADVLLAIKGNPSASLAALADQLGWKTNRGLANKSAVNRVVKTLEDGKFITTTKGVRTVTRAGDELIEMVQQAPM
jgi:hypothetical protein